MKKIFALILAVVMLISLFGCENGKDPVGTTEPLLSDHGHETIGATEAPTEAPTEPASTETAPTEAPTEPVSTEAPTEATEPAPTEAPTKPTETQHKHSYSKKVTAPTCESKGYTTYTCACGHSYRDNETKATGHKYATTTVAPTTTSDGYDLHKCSVCGKEYKDNYVAKTGNSGSSENTEDHTGMYWCTYANEGHGGWVPHDCASDGHLFYDEPVIVQEQTCCQHSITELTCVVVGCNAVERSESNHYSQHVRSVNDITGYYDRYVVRRYDGYMWSFDNEADARAKAAEIVNAYKSGECEYWLDKIWCDKRAIVPEDYTCLVCGETIVGKSRGSFVWDGETEEHIIWTEYYDENNQIEPFDKR